MTEFTCRKGGDLEYVEFKCEVQDNGYVDVKEKRLYAFGGNCPLFVTDDNMHVGIQLYCEGEYARQSKYRKIEQDFKERFGEVISIDNEDSYNYATYEWMKKTADDNSMVDLNGDLRAF